jgi:hypothetical protein
VELATGGVLSESMAAIYRKQRRVGTA